MLMILTCLLVQPSPSSLRWSYTDEGKIVRSLQASSAKREIKSCIYKIVTERLDLGICGQKGKKENNNTRVTKCKDLSAHWGLQ